MSFQPKVNIACCRPKQNEKASRYHKSTELAKFIHVRFEIKIISIYDRREEEKKRRAASGSYDGEELLCTFQRRNANFRSAQEWSLKKNGEIIVIFYETCMNFTASHSEKKGAEKSCFLPLAQAIKCFQCNYYSQIISRTVQRHSENKKKFNRKSIFRPEKKNSRKKVVKIEEMQKKNGKMHWQGGMTRRKLQTREKVFRFFFSGGKFKTKKSIDRFAAFIKCALWEKFFLLLNIKKMKIRKKQVLHWAR